MSSKSVAREILVVVCAALVIVLGYNGINLVLARGTAQRVASVKRSVKELPVATIGSPLKIAGVQSEGAPLSIVLVTSPDCVHCRASESFHRSICQTAREHSIPMYVAVPHPATATSYLDSAGLTDCEIRRWEELPFRVPGTPTLILSDGRGVVRRMWVGRATSMEAEKEVLDFIRDPSGGFTNEDEPSQLGGISVGQLDVLRQKKLAVLLDIRERKEFSQWHTSGAINIPLSELPARARFELDRNLLQVIDCTNLTRAQCAAAVGGVMNEGFASSFVGGWAIWQSCEATAN